AAGRSRRRDPRRGGLHRAAVDERGVRHRDRIASVADRRRTPHRGGRRMGLLEGKVVLVTGSGRGLGRAYALTLAELRARVVVNDVGVSVRGEGCDTTVADELVALLREKGSDAVADYSDVSQWSGSAQAVRTGIEHFGRLDGVVNNAGIFRPTDIA